MRICKYCNKPIAEKDIMNPDNDGNGYHHRCLVDMEFKARDKQIYDKGKMDVLDKIRDEIRDIRYSGGLPTAEICGYIKCLEIIDKHIAERSE